MPDLAEPGPGRAARWGDLRARVISASILAPLALACIWFGGWAFVAMIALIAAGMAAEWAGMCGVSWRQPAALVGMAAVAGASVAAAVAGSRAGPLAGGALLVGGWLLQKSWRGVIGPSPRWSDMPGRPSWPGLTRPPRAAGEAGGWLKPGRDATSGPRVGDLLPFGIPYLGVAAIALVWLRDVPDTGRANLLGLMLLVWGSDIGAYLAGRLLGGPKLAPSISPGKTWSGAVGGLLAAIGIALAASCWLGGSGHLERIVAIAALLGVAAQAGDLLESRIKRHFGVKDSGTLIPGHGGLLDRLDALLIAAPVAAILAWMAAPGVSLWQ